MAKVQELAKQSSKEVTFESIVTNAIKIPGVKVRRDEFLRKEFDKDKFDIEKILEIGPVEAGCTDAVLAKMANKLIMSRTSTSSVASFAAGIPGGLAMGITIPADTLQFFGMTLRLAQEITYLYGTKDLWSDGEVDSEMVRNQLVLYCGVMFGVAGASSGVRLLSAQLAKQAIKKLPQKALTKTIWYPIVRQIGKVIGIKVTKDTAAKGISKVIPVLGGIVSGGLTFVSMRPMGKRLATTLEEANFNYTEEKAQKDYNDLEKMAENCDCEDDIVDVEDVSVADNEAPKTEVSSAEKEDNTDEIISKIEKLAKLKDNGIITDDEFMAKKTELLARI